MIYARSSATIRAFLTRAFEHGLIELLPQRRGLEALEAMNGV